MTTDEDTSAALTARLLEGPDPESEQFQPDLEQQQEELSVNDQDWVVGEKQPPKCRDAVWAALFVIHLVVVAAIAFAWGIPALNYVPTENVEIHLSGVLGLCLLAGLGSVVISGLALGIMIHYAQVLIQFSVLFSMFSSLVLVVLCAYNGSTGGAMFAFLVFLLGCFYAWRVWNRIPFAAANLSTAVTAIRTNLGVTIVAYGLVLKVFAWTCLWLLSIIGVYVKTLHIDENGNYESHMSGFVIVLYLLSYYWTQQVIKNVIHVTVAGVVGTWWIVPVEASSCCSPSILDSFLRSITHSFGSICCGSLLVSVIQVLHNIVIHARRDGQDNIFLCLVECLISILERIMLYFNKFAFVYVGLYGYPYMDAGKRVMTLFQARGWTTIINDDLISNTLGLMSLVIAALTGFVGMAILAMEPAWLSLFENDARSVAFTSAFLIGVMIASTLMSVIASGVDTVIVSFAETPAEFHENHPELSQQMIEAWSAAYPGEYGI